MWESKKTAALRVHARGLIDDYIARVHWRLDVPGKRRPVFMRTFHVGSFFFGVTEEQE